MNWLQRISQIVEGKEHIVDAAIWVEGQFFFGAHHGEAFNKAIEAGALTLDENGDIETWQGHDVHFDLLRTNKGRIMDRFKSSAEFDFSGF